MIEVFILLMGAATLFAAATLWDEDLVRAAAALVAVFLLSGLALLSIGAWFIGAMQVLLGAGAVAILAIYAAVTASQRREVLKAPEAGKIAAVTLAILGFSIGFLTISTPGMITFYSSTAKSIAKVLFSDLGLMAALSVLLLVALIASAYVIRYVSIQEVKEHE
ncbi:hypothetical protein IPA_04720 [Ignicoccus pacificus DSM 13166]|uniref:NADH-quinone oxidoreductase subunit J n=1 Tax=Ignicoccus pacificus DSM 13166 TaxID=940294 RepID=A0A977KB45_9CREN|nr:hypothetical protein IPA_04720 [Ignicoccus pacificus DSM 13166]